MKEYLWFFKRYIRPYWPKIILIIIFAVFVAVSKTIVIGLVKIIPDEIFIAKDRTILYQIPFILIGLFAISGLSRYANFSLSRGMSEFFAQLVRNDIYSHIVKQPISFFSKFHTGNIYSRVITDTNSIPAGALLSLDIFREGLTFFLYFSWALFFNWKLTLIITLAAPIVIIILNLVGKTVKKYTSKNLEHFSNLGVILNETFNGIRIIKAFTVEYLVKIKFMEFNKILFLNIFKNIKIQELSSPVIEFIFSIVASMVIFVGGTWVIDGTLTPGEFLGIFAALGLAQDPLKKLNTAYIQFQTSLAALKRVANVIAMPEENLDAGETFTSFQKSINFKNISFIYQDQEDQQFALDSVEISINKGDIVALVGESGSGKTTLANLLLRFYNPSSGEITIDGENIKKYSLASLRNSIAFVSQDTFLFNDTIENNIKIANSNLTKDELENALECSYSSLFVNKLPLKEKTMVGERGARLSGGEKQRITIARAIAKNAPILILDEATSSLDSKAEESVQKAINNLMQGRTTLLIAHRLSTIINANKIYVFEKGKIVQAGTHSDLINKDGIYKNLYQRQIIS